MSNTPATDRTIAASQRVGADVLFWQVVELVATKEDRQASLSDPIVRERLRAVHERFSQGCAAVVAQHLGPEQARASLAALESPLLQRFFAARPRMAPLLSGHLQMVRKRIAELDL